MTDWISAIILDDDDENEVDVKVEDDKLKFDFTEFSPQTGDVGTTFQVDEKNKGLKEDYSRDLRERLERIALRIEADSRKGSAQNLIDINIPQEFKVDDMVDGFEFKVASLIRKILKSYETEIGNFVKYRSIIRMEKEVFNASVMNLINKANT